MLSVLGGAALLGGAGLLYLTHRAWTGWSAPGERRSRTVDRVVLVQVRGHHAQQGEGRWSDTPAADQMMVTVATLWAVHDTSAKLALKQGLPLLNQVVAWAALGTSGPARARPCPCRASGED
jgi:hypothetical protein